MTETGWASASASWIDWNWFSDSTPLAAATPTLVKCADGSIDLVAVGSDGRMWHKWASGSGRSRMERVTGIEPVSTAWKAAALPLCYTRAGALQILAGRRGQVPGRVRPA